MEAKPRPKRRRIWWVLSLLALLAFLCICSLLWLAWTFGDAVIRSLLG